MNYGETTIKHNNKTTAQLQLVIYRALAMWNRVC